MSNSFSESLERDEQLIESLTKELADLRKQVKEDEAAKTKLQKKYDRLKEAFDRVSASEIQARNAFRAVGGKGNLNMPAVDRWFDLRHAADGARTLLNMES